jgi:NADP-dependent 3-hydroxy acid dehydrogenase YdfG
VFPLFIAAAIFNNNAMQINLENELAVVTGSTAGIGFAIARDWRPLVQTWLSTAARSREWMKR